MNKLHGKLAFIITLFLIVICIDLISANPLPMPLVNIHSPQNNQIFQSDSVQLSFTPVAENCTSFSYALDDQPSLTTDGNTLLTNLSWGSHKLTIYANQTFRAMGFVEEGKNMVASIVYFSVVYSNALLMVLAIVLPTIIIISLLLLFMRRKIAARLRHQKGLVFWFGTFMFGSSTFVFLLYSWFVVSDYLFPYWPKGITIVPPYWLFSTVCFAFIGVGLAMMWLGTQKKLETRKQD
jgi:hypothetical protein